METPASLMSASPKNAGLELMLPSPQALSPAEPAVLTRPSHEALQALLAFSALHDQIRRRRSHNGTAAEDHWQLEHFVLDEVLYLVALRALAITGADGIAIALAENNAIICRAVAGTIVPDVGMRLEPNSGFSGACLISGNVVRCDDAQLDSRVDRRTCELLGTRSMLAVPLSARQRVIGLIEAFSSDANGFNDSDVRSLKLLAELILAALKPEEEDRLAEISRRVVVPITPPEAPKSEGPKGVAIEQPAAAIPLSKQLAELDRLDEPEPLLLPEPEEEASEPEQAAEAEPVLETVPEPEPEPASAPQGSHPGIAVVVSLLMIAMTLGAGLWWSIRRHSRSQSTRVQAAAPAATTGPIQSESQQADVPEEESPLPAPAASTSGLPQVTGIRHWSTADSTTVVIDLQDQVQYEAHRLSNPERIYFDLHDTKLANSLGTRVIAVGEPLLQRIRVAQPVSGMTRVVLETTGASNFSVSLEENPYRLVVEVRKIGAAQPPRARLDLFGPGEQAPSLSVATRGTGKPMLASASGPHIVLDAGHGGWDLGTVGRKGLLEKDLVLDVVRRLGSLIETRMGANVVYTRSDDAYVPLEKRAEIANLSKADMFVSIHANYSDSASARGVETYYSNTYSSVRARTNSNNPVLQNVNWTSVDIRAKVHESRLLASSVQHALYSALATSNPDLPNRGVKEAQYVVLTGTSMPAILAEVSFVSSPTDENNLQSEKYRQRIAEALYQGLAHYEQSSHAKPVVSIASK